MSLQGTLATFSIPDVLQLLASTKKSGKLSVTGDRGRGDLWLDAGSVVAADGSGDPTSTDPVTVVMSMLRFEEGSFIFEDGAVAASPGKPREVNTLLEEATSMKAEWAELEAVVPSSNAWLSLAEDLPEDEVIIDREVWMQIRTVATGSTAGAFGAALDLDTIETARAVKALVDRGLLEVANEPPAGALTASAPAAPPIAEPEPASFAEPEPEPAPAFEPLVVTEPEPAPEPEPEPVAFDDTPTWTPLEPVTEPEPATFEPVDEEEPPVRESASAFDPNEMLSGMGLGSGHGGGGSSSESDADDGFLPAADGGLGGLGGAPAAPAATATVPDIDPNDAAEMARQLANLSPEAAKAVAAAAKATTAAEMEAALDEVVALDSSINRDLLMKFLGSVNS